ncbi:MAG: hypothetical protein P8102_12095 [Gammaproteobacteria bacterium]
MSQQQPYQPDDQDEQALAYGVRRGQVLGEGHGHVHARDRQEPGDHPGHVLAYGLAELRRRVPQGEAQDQTYGEGCDKPREGSTG